MKTNKINLKNTSLENVELLVLGVFDDKKLSIAQKKTDSIVGHIISNLLEKNEFKAKRNTSHLLYSNALEVQRILVIGLGKRKGFSLHNLREAMGIVAKKADALKIKNVTAEIVGKSAIRKPIESVLENMAIGFSLGGYKFLDYKTGENNDDLKINLEILVEGHIYVAQKRALEKGISVADSVRLSRDLANHPGNVATPTYLAKTAREIGKLGGMNVTVIDKKDFKKMGLGAIAGVAQGSDETAKMIIMEYKTEKKTAKTLGLVGKGLTFDSGGISLKPGAKMDQMKFDMCGSATVLGIMNAVAHLNPEVNVIAVIGAAENMPSGKAYKPGDILKAYNGKTIEVLNTDAEGRIVLADALSYITKNFHLDALVDFATLTGAVISCLGHEAAAVMGTESSFVKRLLKSGENSGDRLWELPLWDDFCEDTKSKIADVKNIGSRGAGTIMGGAFLKEFVESDVPWAHIDIAGVAWDSKEKPHIPKGPSGFGVRLILDLIDNF